MRIRITSAGVLPADADRMVGLDVFFQGVDDAYHRRVLIFGGPVDNVSDVFGIGDSFLFPDIPPGAFMTMLFE